MPLRSAIDGMWPLCQLLCFAAAASAQADIYSFGLVLWEIVTREAPAEEQLRQLHTPSECPEVRRCCADTDGVHKPGPGQPI